MCKIGLGLTVMGHSLMVGKFAVIVIGQCRRQISVRCETLFKALRYGVDKENKVKRLRDIPVDIKLGTQQRRH